MTSSFHQFDDDSEGQLEFVQDQVRRLTAVVREYQRRYLPIDERVIEDAPLAPWMTDSRMLSPLLVEYDSNIKSLKEQIKHYKDGFDNLQNNSKRIIDENERLHQELRRTVEKQLDAMQHSDGLTTQTQIQLDQLQQKLKMLSNEKDKVGELYEGTSRNLRDAKEELRDKVHQLGSLTSEVQALREDVKKARAYAEKLEKPNQRLKAENEQFLKTAQIQDAEMDDMRSQQRKLNGEMKTQKDLNHELQRHVNKVEEQLRYLDNDARNEMITEKSAEGTIRKLQNEIVELDSRVVIYSKELSKLRADKVDLEEQLASLQKKNTVIEENEYQAILRVRDSVQLVENALLEREQAIFREQQKTQEVSRLQEAINNLLKQAEEQRKTEVTNMKTQSNKQIQQLMEDLHLYEIEGAEKQAAFERIQREKNSLEKELEKIYQEGPTEVTKAGLTLDELQKKLSKIEMSRDEALLHIDSLQATLRRSKQRYESDKTGYLNQLNDYKKQVKTLKDDLNEVVESRLKLLDEVTSLKKELQAKREDNVALDMSCASQVTTLQQKLEMKEKEFTSRLRAAESTNKEAMNELREMLAVQQKNGSKWRDESRNLCQKFESTISQLRLENNSFKRRNEDLVQAYNEVVQKAEEMEKDYYANQVTIDKFQRLYTEAEERAEAANTQVQTLLNREKQLLQDRKSLNREVDKLRLDLSRPSRQQTVEHQWDSYIENYAKDHS